MITAALGNSAESEAVGSDGAGGGRCDGVSGVFCNERSANFPERLLH